jgi:hypothetical protein
MYNGYPYFFRNLLNKVRCTTQPLVISTPGKNPKIHQKFFQKSNLVPVSYSPVEVEGIVSLLTTLFKQWLEAQISNRQDSRGRRWESTTSASSYPSTAENAGWEVRSSIIRQCQLYVSRDVENNCVDWVAGVNYVADATVHSRSMQCKQLWKVYGAVKPRMMTVRKNALLYITIKC